MAEIADRLGAGDVEAVIRARKDLRSSGALSPLDLEMPTSSSALASLGQAIAAIMAARRRKRKARSAGGPRAMCHRLLIPASLFD